MRRRHVLGPAVAGLALAAVGVTIPAPATAATTAPPCTDLLGCLVPTVTTTTGALTTTVTGTVQTLTTTTLPAVINVVPSTLNALLLTTKPSPPPTKPTGPPAKHPQLNPGHVKHPGARPTAVSGNAAAATAPRTTPASQSGGKSQAHAAGGNGPFSGLGGAVTKAVETVVNLFGWNLLALIPMAGIAFVISRRMGSSRPLIRL